MSAVHGAHYDWTRLRGAPGSSSPCSDEVQNDPTLTLDASDLHESKEPDILHRLRRQLGFAACPAPILDDHGEQWRTPIERRGRLSVPRG
jgi:hypothetical protein